MLDQALKAGCDVPLAKMVLGKIIIEDLVEFWNFFSALREVKAEFLMTSLQVVG